ncbi:cell division protein FtsA [Persephonella hydrogeniphila]|uniref:Cell division protein FtsA n=1 Tax=Persephonella hydrogeniphila TaxID=198703 RepID=A0A285MYS1_9AQUI|nr:cell division protein FtsA [Persephonella hydrogeniphila]SNZ02360.1 cell division protein FtsA [Persephonella hydrogeniphila]
MGKENVIVALDIGTSKITTLIGDIDDSGNLVVAGFGEAPSMGIEKGIIVKPNDVISAIRKSVDEAESTAGSKISGVIANVSGYHIECRNDAEKIEFNTSQKIITQMDISQLIEKVASKIQPQKENLEVIHIIPKKYILDNEDEVIDPIGLVASKIEGKFHIVLDKINAYTNLKKVIESSGLRVIDFVANPIASATAVLYPEEKEMGIVVLDIGAGTTDMAVYKDGSIEYIKSFPVGGNQVTMDIAHRFKVSKEEAEKLKTSYGAAIPDFEEGEIIEVYPRGSEEPIHVDQLDLVDTIEARLSEIFEIAKRELEELGYLGKVNGGVVLTGGVAKTPYIKELAESIFGLDVRIGKPKAYTGFSDKVAFPEYATSIGMLLFAKNKVSSMNTQPVSNSSSFDILKIGKSLIEKIKSIF